MSDQPCPCCGHDPVAVKLVIGEELEENQRLKAEVERLKAERDAAVARGERAKEALTPSAETQAAYMGEFLVKYPELDEDGNDRMRVINIPWAVIKKIMAAIKGRADAALSAHALAQPVSPPPASLHTHK